MIDCEARYEFRAFAVVPDARLERIVERVESLYDARGAAGGIDHYLLAASGYHRQSYCGRETLNLKISNERLQLKTLLRMLGVLEQWRPEFEEEFPLSKRLLEQVLNVFLGLECAEQRRDRYSVDDVLESVGPETPGLDLFSVSKQRRKFEGEGCLAEVVEVLVSGVSPLLSVAIESCDPDALFGQASRLELTDFTNVSYPSMLRQVSRLEQIYRQHRGQGALGVDYQSVGTL